MRPVIVVGAGGHARVLIDALQRAGAHIAFATDADPSKQGQTLLGVVVRGGDEAIAAHGRDQVLLAIGVGSMGNDVTRRAIFEWFETRGYRFATVVHPAATIARDVTLLDGAQVMAGAVVQTGTWIGRNAILNTRAGVDHDCRIGDHAHIAPGATICGGVELGEGAFVGAGACVIQAVRIGAGSVIGAGAVVVRDVPAGARVMGVPARGPSR